ncbi:YcxB family protein [Psychrobacter sp. AOP22-C1-22]|uniref:YcxB family protein n=1 Tax=unclassified Psychrobacter TaxID=196806 RepID=UPI0017884574|nr:MULTISPECIES: YcxB family protein [unclassified Psychrobacter]MBE0405811.1 YcxB family protein [Psychrobacter sp. FME6]MBE0444271.1 YcxB family protein [Psychrobacter sp. FME5]
MALYPYTLQPVALNLTEAEFHQAQYELFASASPSFGLSSFKTKEWIIMAVVVILAIAGLVFVTGYSTIIFWLMLVAVVVYLLVRTLGFKWYVKREFEKQVAEQEMPDEMRQMKLGVQKHGLVMAMPVNQPDMFNSNQMRGMQMRAGQTQQAVIPWSAVKSWDETDDYIFMMFEMKGQQGSQIIPKRLKAQKFPIDTVRQHLEEVIAVKGLNPENLQPPA